MKKDTQKTALGFPGHVSPNASFDDPIAMLFECHNRVRASLDLLLKINIHLKTRGGDTHTARAAADVLRYFDIAAPLHHQDEELHVFPPLRESHVVAIQTYVARVQAEHRQMDDHWLTLRTFLLEVANEEIGTKWSQAFEEQVLSFQALYKEHLEIEEQLLLPALSMQVTAEELESMGIEMRQRRGASA
ncbi:MAG: hemerythrin domain-containing protein [Casimicrobium sp.]